MPAKRPGPAFIGPGAAGGQWAWPVGTPGAARKVRCRGNQRAWLLPASSSFKTLLLPDKILLNKKNDSLLTDCQKVFSEVSWIWVAMSGSVTVSKTHLFSG